MTTEMVESRESLDLDAFVHSLPTSKSIKDRLGRNSAESTVLKRLLRVVVAAEKRNTAVDSPLPAA